MIRFFKGLVLLPVAIVVVALAVANREVVRLSFDPFTADTPAFSLPLPLYVLIFASVAIGILCGGIGTWLGQSGTRRTSAARRREIRRLEGETERLKSRVAASEPTPAERYPDQDGRVALPAPR
ncbi:LapA family protein [Methylobacterium sp. SD274]|uniref:LapA family protein n=1 Tax=Methylobacterium sp. SD274 TaxID=2782009 RepID=UPI001A962EAE|nr:LapA family protein [Methylobacterium sp. SD274]MBO1019950.1 LapA family protein [Methylobacterium sp. SD274]